MKCLSHASMGARFLSSNPSVSNFETTWLETLGSFSSVLCATQFFSSTYHTVLQYQVPNSSSVICTTQLFRTIYHTALQYCVPQSSLVLPHSYTVLRFIQFLYQLNALIRIFPAIEYLQAFVKVCVLSFVRLWG